MKGKKIILTAVVIFLVILIGGGIYFFFFGRTDSDGSPITPKNFFPFGNADDVEQIDQETYDENNTGPGSSLSGVQSTSNLRVLSEEVLAGVIFAENEKGVEVIRLIERGLGHVFETTVDSPTLTRISNTTIPKIQDVVWAENGGAIIIRYLDDDDETIETFVARISPDSVDVEGEDAAGEGGLSGTLLTSQNVRFVSSSGDGSKIFYLIPSGEEYAGVTSNVDGSSSQTLFSLPVGEWSSQWPGQSTIYLTTSPSHFTAGSLYALSASSGSLRKVLGDVSGLTTNLSNDGRYVLYSRSEQDSFTTHDFDRESAFITELPVRTLPEKCVWSDLESGVLYCAVPKTIPRADYPEAWYQGKVHFSDAFWKIDLVSGATDLLYDGSTSVGQGLDATHLDVNSEETHVVFIDKNTGLGFLLDTREN